ncbi:MAG: hypothetical protein ACLT21_03715 [Oscillospiraceae bacterium]
MFSIFPLIWRWEALTPTIYNTVAAVLQRTFCIFGKIVVYAKKHTCFWPLCPGNGASVGINAAKENGATEAVPLSENERFLSLFNYPAL